MMLAAGLHDVPNGHLAAVVTYLEMSAPVMAASKPFPEGFTAQQEQLSNDSYRAIFRAIGAPWLWTSRLTLADDALATILTNPQIEHWVVRNKSEAIALIELDFSAQGICELAFFGMVKSVTGQGLGGPMMTLAQERAFHGEAELFTVHTCSLDDPRALGFYLHAGFVPVRRAVEIFEDPRLDGFYDPTTAPQIPCLP